MHTHAEKAQKYGSKSISNDRSMRKDPQESAIPWNNQRPEFASQNKLQDTLNNSVKVQKTAQLQSIVARNTPTTSPLQLTNNPLQFGNGKKSKHNRKARSMAKPSGLYFGAGEEVTPRIVAEAVEARDNEPGLDTNHLAKKVLPGSKKVALVGENHGEVNTQLEDTYFTCQSLGYHHEISSYNNEYTETQGKLHIQNDADDFAIENIPLRALSQVVDMIKWKDDLSKIYLPAIHTAWSECLILTSNMDKWKNTKMLSKAAKKLHRVKYTFITKTYPKIKDDTSLFMGPLNSLETEMLYSASGLEGTSVFEEGRQLYLDMYTAYTDFKAHIEIVPKFFIPEDTEELNAIDELETTEDFEDAWPAIQKLYDFDETLKDLLPKLQVFLKKVVAKQAPAAVTLAGTGTDTGDQITKGRSEAMLNNAIWLANNTTKAGEVVKVGDAHIDDVKTVRNRERKLAIITKSDYYLMQDQTNTSDLRESD